MPKYGQFQYSISQYGQFPIDEEGEIAYQKQEVLPTRIRAKKKNGGYTSYVRMDQAVSAPSSEVKIRSKKKGFSSLSPWIKKDNVVFNDVSPGVRIRSVTNDKEKSHWVYSQKK